jgi:signal transduction histidine kinase
MKTSEKRKSTVLIVDDDASARDTLQALLSAENYELTFAVSGEEALAKLAANLAPDAILLDVMMPGMGGFEVCQCVKRDQRWQRIPIVLVTALDQKEHIISGLEAGADEFLSKPVNGAELRARLRSVVRLKQQYDGLEALTELREKMARLVVHDMRSPLTVIQMQCDLLLLDPAVPPQIGKDLDTIKQHAQRLSDFTNDILLMSKLAHGKLVLNRQPVDIGGLLRNAVQNQQPIAASRQVNLTLALPAGGTPVLSLDANLIQRAVENLISNAIKFSPAQSAVTVQGNFPDAPPEALPGAARNRILVLDAGRGIPEAYRHRLFEPFATIELKDKGVPQTGLGLHFCKLVAETHGGRIWVEPNQPQGSRFIMEI